MSVYTRVHTRRENNIKNYDSIIVPWSHVAPTKDFSQDIEIFHPYSIENIGDFDIFRPIFQL